VLGFLSVSTPLVVVVSLSYSRFNPVLGFLSVSTSRESRGEADDTFQSRAGFSECLDLITVLLL